MAKVLRPDVLNTETVKLNPKFFNKTNICSFNGSKIENSLTPQDYIDFSNFSKKVDHTFFRKFSLGKGEVIDVSVSDLNAITVAENKKIFHKQENSKLCAVNSFLDVVVQDIRDKTENFFVCDIETDIEFVNDFITDESKNEKIVTFYKKLSDIFGVYLDPISISDIVNKKPIKKFVKKVQFTRDFEIKDKVVYKTDISFNIADELELINYFFDVSLSYDFDAEEKFVCKFNKICLLNELYSINQANVAVIDELEYNPLSKVDNVKSFNIFIKDVEKYDLLDSVGFILCKMNNLSIRNENAQDVNVEVYSMKIQ